MTKVLYPITPTKIFNVVTYSYYLNTNSAKELCAELGRIIFFHYFYCLFLFWFSLRRSQDCQDLSLYWEEI